MAKAALSNALTLAPTLTSSRAARDGARRFDNQLEPAALIDWFLTHPPETFRILDAGSGDAPAFASVFYLLSTADPVLRQYVEALPLFSLWARWLRPRTSFVGTTVSEYALVRGGADISRLPGYWKARWASQFPLLIVKDIPRRSPLLSKVENQRADELADSCVDEGYFLVEGQALAYVPIDFPNVATFLKRLSPSRQKNLRRKMRSLDELIVTEVRTGDAEFADEKVIDAYHALYLSVFAQSDIQFDKLSRDFLASLLRDRRASGIVFEYRRRGTDASLVGWNLCFVFDGRLVDKYIGLAYPAARELNLYFVSWILNLEFACKAGLSHYVAGWTDPIVKGQLGATFTFTRHAVYSRYGILRAVGRQLSRHLESDCKRIESCT